MAGEAEFTIDELAREAGTTVRNIRAYQERGGRAGWGCTAPRTWRG